MSHLILFFLLSISSICVEASESPESSDVNAVTAIFRDIEGLVGDTVNEGSWMAEIKEAESSCEAVTRTHYRCRVVFLLTPYDTEEIDADPWTVVCHDLNYRILARKLAGLIRVKGRAADLQNCIELLSEGP